MFNRSRYFLWYQLLFVARCLLVRWQLVRGEDRATCVNGQDIMSFSNILSTADIVAMKVRKFQKDRDEQPMRPSKVCVFLHVISTYLYATGADALIIIAQDLSI